MVSVGAALPGVRRGPRPLSLLGIALGLLWATLLWASVLPQLGGAAGAGAVDFFTFLDSSRVWLAGGDPYAARLLPGAGGATTTAHPNLNHPATIIALAPLTLLSPAGAFAAWAVVSALCYLLAAGLALRLVAPGAGRSPGWWLLIATLPGFVYDRQLGQLGGVLALLAVLAWAGLRGGTPRATLAGAALLGLLVVLKPFFVPLALLLPLGARGRWSRLAAFAGGVAAPCLFALPSFGLGGFLGWLRRGSEVTWYDHGFNASLTGVVARLTPGPLPGWLPWALAVGVWLAALPLLRLAPPAGLARADRDFALLLTLAILGSPLGWLYYIPLLLPAFAILWARGRRLPSPARQLAVASAIGLWLPHALLPLYPDAPWSTLTLRALTTYGLLLLVAALVIPARRLTVPAAEVAAHPA